MMTKTTDNLLIRHCLIQVEKKLNWGSVDGWSTQDFEKLSEHLLTATGTSLSVATLKRLWGTVKYDSQPTVTTLNALSKYLGFESWRDFVQSQAASNSVETNQTEVRSERRPIQRKILLYGSPVLIAILLFAGVNFMSSKSVSSELNPELFAFSSEKMVDEGVPNSVIFSYDAAQADDGDVLFIQQSWDERLRSSVSKDEHIHTSIYYHPGYFEAKLVVNEQVVKEHHLFIKTDGWLPMVELEGVPLYFEQEDLFAQKGILSLSPQQLTDKNVRLQPETPWVSFYNVGMLEDIYIDDVVFETQIKNDYAEGTSICQHSEIYLILEGGSISVPLSVKGCVSDLEFYSAQGKRENPSKLGVDFGQWVDIKLTFSGADGNLWINNELAYPITYPYGKKKIVGVRYRFQGAGSVNSLSVAKNDSTVVYQDDFGS